MAVRLAPLLILLACRPARAGEPATALARLLTAPLCHDDFTDACFEGVEGDGLPATIIESGYAVNLEPDRSGEAGWRFVNVESGTLERGSPVLGPLSTAALSRRLDHLHGVIDKRTPIPGARYGGRIPPVAREAVQRGLVAVDGSFYATTLGGGRVATMRVAASVPYLDPTYVAERVAAQLAGSVLGGAGTVRTVEAYVGDVYVHYTYSSCSDGAKLCVEKTVESVADVAHEVDAADAALAAQFIAARKAALRTEEPAEVQRYFLGLATRTLDSVDANLTAGSPVVALNELNRRLEPARIALRAAALLGSVVGADAVTARLDRYAAKGRFAALPDLYTTVDRRWSAWGGERATELLERATASARTSLAACGVGGDVVVSEPTFFGRSADIRVAVQPGGGGVRYPLNLASTGTPTVVVPCSAAVTPAFLAKHPEWVPWFQGGEGYDLTEVLVGEVDACATRLGVSWGGVGISPLRVEGDRVLAEARAEWGDTLKELTVEVTLKAGGPELGWPCPP